MILQRHRTIRLAAALTSVGIGIALVPASVPADDARLKVATAIYRTEESNAGDVKKVEPLIQAVCYGCRSRGYYRGWGGGYGGCYGCGGGYGYGWGGSYAPSWGGYYQPSYSYYGAYQPYYS